MTKIDYCGVQLMVSDDKKWTELSDHAQQELIAQVKKGMVKPVLIDARAQVIEGEEILLAAIRGKVKNLFFVVVAVIQENSSPILPSPDSESFEDSAENHKVTESQCRQWAESHTDSNTPPIKLDRFCVFVSKPSDLKRALQAMQDINPEALPNRKIAVRGLLTLADKQKAEQIASQPIQELIRPEVELHCGDFRTLGDQIADNSIDGINTDPPYDKASIELYADSAKLAMRVLKPGGIYITYAGKMHLPQVYAALERSGLEYVWQCAITHNTGHNITWPSRMISGHKPILIYRKPGGPKINWSPFLDICSDGKQEQTLHPWQQALAESEYFISKIFVPGSTILDPMCGSGTVLVAAINCGMNTIGIEQDTVTFETARKRIEEYLIKIQFSSDLGTKADGA